ncbi:MAG: hypothetical protein CM15mP49_15120 [Actinomycetota bacterium]|nr:MAG: hypothetical protein CM15mP49_15120 [Actinomycetota bacterium]
MRGRECPLHLTARNALLVCELAGRPDVKSSPDVTVLWFETCHCRGHTWRNWIGWTAMGSPTGQLQDQHAVDWLVETLLNAEDKEITLCPVGPLTNIAMALVREPKIASKVDQIVSMGGGYFVGGNITPAAEFNIFVDPHAADVVYRSGIPIVAMPLDVTHKALMTQDWIQTLEELGTEVGKNHLSYCRFTTDLILRDMAWPEVRSTTLQPLPI